MTIQERIFTQLSKNSKKKLSKQKKVDLSSIDRVSELLDNLQNLDSDINESVNKANDLADTVFPMITDILANYEGAGLWLDDAKNTASELYISYSLVNSQAEELGLNVEDVLKDLDKITDLLDVYLGSPSLDNVLNSSAKTIIDNTY
jgi:hypothetical protein